MIIQTIGHICDNCCCKDRSAVALAGCSLIGGALIGAAPVAAQTPALVTGRARPEVLQIDTVRIHDDTRRRARAVPDDRRQLVGNASDNG